MTKNEQRIIELETEVRMLRESLAYERSKPAEVKYIPTPSWPNHAGWGPSRGPFNPHYPGLVNNFSVMNHCDNNIAYLSSTASKVLGD